MKKVNPVTFDKTPFMCFEKNIEESGLTGSWNRFRLENIFIDAYNNPYKNVDSIHNPPVSYNNQIKTMLDL